MTFSIGARIGPYEVVALVGRGGMGEVYRARDLRLQRDVAIKILPAEVAESSTRRARFEREAHAISRLSHPHICTLYDIGDDAGLPFLVMEYVDGESLEQRLRAGPLPRTLALQSAIQIASAVAAAHDRDIVHRDLKPANVMLGDQGVKLLDFGIAKLLDHGPEGLSSVTTATSNLTAEHKVLGTPNYMSPEQLEGGRVDTRSDIFAFGAVLHEMLTGEKAFDGLSPASVTAAVLTAEPPAVSALVNGSHMVPAALDHLVRRALAKKPDERWQTARDVMHELEWIASGPPSTTAPAPSRNVWWPLGLSAAALLMAIVLLTVARIRPPSTPAGPLTIFTFGAPEGAKLAPDYGMLAVSPNGQKIAFTASELGENSIWIRDLDSMVPQRVRNTEGGGKPFWSPDSQSIGFFAKGNTQIKIVGIDGTRPRLVFEGQSSSFGPLAASWTTDDRIIFSVDRRLVTVLVTGGPPTVLAAPDGSKNEREFLLPTSIDPAHTLYLVKNNSGTFIGSQVAGGTGKTKALNVKSNAMIARDYLVFRQDSGLVAQQFDRRDLQLLGPTFAIAQDVDYSPANNRAVFSVSPDLLAYRSAVSWKLTWIDRSGNRSGSIGEAGRDWNPVIAPDGSGRVAIDRFVSPDRVQIFLIDEQGRSFPLSHGGRDRYAVWSHDGSAVAYSTASGTDFEIHKTSPAGSAPDELVARFSEETPSRLLDWTKDDAFLIFERSGDLWALRLSDKMTIQLTRTPVTESQARVSPDGHWIAYSSDTNGARQLFVQPFPDGPSGTQILIGNGTDPSWRRDGRELYFLASDGSLMARAISTTSPLSLEPAVRLFQIERGDFGAARHLYSASPDGQRFLVAEPVRADPVIIVMLHWQRLVHP